MKVTPRITIAAPIIPDREDFSIPITAPVKTTRENESSMPASINVKPKNLFWSIIYSLSRFL